MNYTFKNKNFNKERINNETIQTYEHERNEHNSQA